VRNEEWNKVHDLVVVAASGVFTSCGIAAAYVGTVPYRDTRWAETISIIGLGGPKLRGSLVLSIPGPLLAQSNPVGGTQPAELADWLGELANLLLGKIKSRLLSHDVLVELSTPLTISATDLRFEFASPPVVYEFRAGGVPLHVVFESIAERAVRLIPRPDVVVMEPGDIVTFSA
jgi:hypothetical protein